ncbi:hypothetical protein CIK05_04015 [Bdellovibrio sp. qaytius]|nr:hypothetical protein CIK05_04015 [Bdellovibrio sp. qaytius]
MIKLITLCFLFTSASYASTIVKSEDNALTIKTVNNDVEVQLPEVALQVLTKWNSDFKIFSQADYSKSVLELFKDLGENQTDKPVPMAFIEDLDGNGQKDIVLLGSDSKNQFAVALIQTDKKWSLVKITQWSIKNIKESVIPTGLSGASGTAVTETGIPFYVLKAMGEQADKLKEKKKVGIQVENFMGSGEVFEINNKKAVKFTL